MLAGEPQQIVMTAGSFVLYTIDDKRLFFFSSKSGHFQPCYDSLRHIRARLAEIGVPPQSVVLVPDVDISSAVLKVYKIAQVPVSLNSQDSERLFLLADRRWKEVYQRIDRHMLSNLANGDFSDLDAKTSEHLTQQREEATYMRSAYHLFSSNHRHPEIFHELVKRFGKLKDAIKHRVPHRIQSEASRLLNVMDQYEEAIANYPFAPATDASSYTFLSGLVSGMEFLCSEKKLLVRDYHDLKKMARELATLFFYMAQDLKWKGKKYFIYNTASLGFFQINEMLAKAHDAYVSQVMRGQLDPAEAVYIDVSSRIVELLTRYLKHLGISPASFAIRIDEEEAKWIINSAKQIYLSHHHFLPHPKALNKSSEARDLLREIVYDREITETAVALEQLELLKKHAEVAIHILAFLDASHQRPEALQTYIHSLAQIIKAVKNNEPRAAWEEAGFMLSLCEQSFPSRALEQWQCTDQASFNETLKSCLSPLCELKEGNFISLERAKEILEQTQALRDLVNLFRKNGRMPKKEGLHPLPMACYDHLEEQADGLIEELGQAIFMESEPIWVTPQMVIHSSDILSKLF